MGYWKRTPTPKLEKPKEIPALVQEISIPTPTPKAPLPKAPEPAPVAAPTVGLPDANRIASLFATDASKLPIVETVSYTSRVPWIQGRPAWVADYASYYNTSRHFIARSLNKKVDYFTQKIGPGDRFNVFRKDKNIQFYLVGDLSRCRIWFYYIDLDLNERVLLKTYSMGVGRAEPKKESGNLTPIGKYSFGDKVALYKPTTMGFYQDQQIELIRIFGTRWIPFDQEIEGCTEPSKGFGIHGAPWVEDPTTHKWVEDLSPIGKYESDGCIRLSGEDIEEIFAIVITKPTVIELVTDFYDAKPPGIEKNP
jgi:hypothetical protein